MPLKCKCYQDLFFYGCFGSWHGPIYNVSLISKITVVKQNWKQRQQQQIMKYCLYLRQFSKLWIKFFLNFLIELAIVPPNFFSINKNPAETTKFLDIAGGSWRHNHLSIYTYLWLNMNLQNKVFQIQQYKMSLIYMCYLNSHAFLVIT